MIHLNNIMKSFGNVKAVDNISFDIGKGEVVGLLGPNGAGKTTTMRIITGFIKPNSGSVLIDGDSIDKQILVKSKIGYLPENCPLYIDLETNELIKYFCKLRKIPSNQISARIDKIVETCGLGDVRYRTVGELSKGFKQRVGLSLALVHEPPILILDEPTSGLDPNQIVEIRKLIKEIGKEKTVILSTHIMQEVEATCQKAIIINEGKLISEGTLSELKSNKKDVVIFEIKIKASRSDIESVINNIDDFRFEKWLSDESADIQSFVCFFQDQG